jgi:HK97 family phage major capsid protein
VKTKHNAKSNGRFNALVVKWGALAILALLAITVLPGAAEHPELLLACGFVLPVGILGGKGRMLLEADKGGGMGETEFQGKVLGNLDAIASKQKELEGKVAEVAQRSGDIEGIRTDLNGAIEDVKAIRRQALAARSNAPATRGSVGEECARHLGALALAAGLRGGQLNGDRYEGLVKDILGAEHKTALSSTDIPLPISYSGEVVELVSQFGAARQFGTVFPLGSGSVKLPRIKTNPVFGLIAASGTVTEKSPQTEWVTFSPEKFGGLVRLPSEIDEDSIVAIGQFVARYSARQIAKVEDHNFFVSTGAVSGANGSVKGIAVSVIDNSKVVQQASTKTKTSDVTLANLRAIRALVDAAAIAMGSYYLHPSMEQALSGLNTSGDKPYLANGSRGATLDGFPIRWVDVLPVYSTSAQASTVYALFGDLSFQYLGVRGGVRFDTSKEAGFTTDEILIRALERFTIGLMATGAVSGLQTAAS